MVHVKLIANYREYLPLEAKNGVVDLDVADGTTVRQVLLPFGIPLDDTSVIVLNGRTVDLDAPLAPGDTVSAFSAIAGG